MKHAIEKNLEVISKIGLQFDEPFLRGVKEELRVFLSQNKASVRNVTLCCSESVEPALQLLERIEVEDLHFTVHLKNNFALFENQWDVDSMLNALANKHVEYVILFDTPNMKKSWEQGVWQKKDFLEQFVAKYLEIAEKVISRGMKPVFAPLEPGGDYWDTAFLRSVIETMQSNESFRKESLILCAYARTHQKNLNWGKGGQAVWPSALPYNTPAGSQDQRGFRIFEWYQTIAKAVFNQEIPMMLLDGGHYVSDEETSSKQLEIISALWRVLEGEEVKDPLNEEQTIHPIPEYISMINFLINSEKDFEELIHLGKAHAKQIDEFNVDDMQLGGEDSLNNTEEQDFAEYPQIPNHFLAHYLLLPTPDFLNKKENTNALSPYINHYKPAIGFSIEEAKNARLVSVVIDRFHPAEESIKQLEQIGCEIRKINLDKPNISNQSNEEDSDAR